MSRFWMVQQILCAVGLLVSVTGDRPWWSTAIGAVGFVFISWQFMRACERDDARRPLVIRTDRQP